ncbi:MAG: hypothetical protein LBR88_06855 [Zoogloeaceae bacterium]|jgi:hypothetical protein|nr:hypothetical protein [Zoogloeaceae bacterium]
MKTLPIYINIPRTHNHWMGTLIISNYAEDECQNITAEILREDNINGNPHDPKVVLRTVLRERKNLVRRKLISGHMPYGVHRILGVEPQYYVFLREPVALLASYIRHGNKAMKVRLENNLLPSDAGWSELALKLYNCPSLSEALDIVLAPDFCPAGNAYRNLMTHYVSGCSYTEPVSLSQLNVAIDNLRASTFVGICEEFELSVLMMAKKLKWRNIVPMIVGMGYVEERERGVPAEIRARLVRPLAYDQALYEVGQDIFHEAVLAESSLLSEAAGQMKEIHQQLIRDDLEIMYRKGLDFFDVRRSNMQLQKAVEMARTLNANLSPASPLGRWQKICAAA